MLVRPGTSWHGSCAAMADGGPSPAVSDDQCDDLISRAATSVEPGRRTHRARIRADDEEPALERRLRDPEPRRTGTDPARALSATRFWAIGTTSFWLMVGLGGGVISRPRYAANCGRRRGRRAVPGRGGLAASRLRRKPYSVFSLWTRVSHLRVPAGRAAGPEPVRHPVCFTGPIRAAPRKSGLARVPQLRLGLDTESAS